MEFISIDRGNLDAITAAWAQSPQIVMQELFVAVTEADALLERAAKERTPSGASGGGAGGLKGSIYSDETLAADNVLGVVASPLSYAEPVELGTRPHFPPIQPLIDWVRVKLGIGDDKEAKRAAYAIARTIAQRGTLGVGMFHLSLAYNEAQVGEFFSRALERIGARLPRTA